MNESSYLAFDLGASSGRAILGTLREGRMQMEELHRFATPIIERGERLYWDLEALWQELNVGWQRALSTAPDLRSLSIDSWGVDYVPLGLTGEPIREAHCYRDPRVLGGMERAFRQVSAEAIYAATGIQFMEINTLYQLLADQQEDPRTFARTLSRLTIADYFNFRFSGTAAIEVSLASTTQLLDARTRAWSPALMERFGIPMDTLPEVVSSGTRLGRAFGSEVEVIAGLSHDTACAVAAVPVEPDVGSWAYLSCGTWSLLGVELPEPLLTEEARRAGVTNEAGLGGTVRLLKNLNGLWVLQECEREWREAGEHYVYDDLIREAEAAPPPQPIDLNDPRFGLRGGMQEKVRAYCREQGRSIPRSRGELVRLILTSLAEAHRQTLRMLEALLDWQISTLYIVGGGSRNTLLCRLTADACGCRVVAGPAEATALGNLLVQAQAIGDLPEGMSIRDVVRVSTELRVSEPEHRGSYEPLPPVSGM